MYRIEKSFRQRRKVPKKEPPERDKTNKLDDVEYVDCESEHGGEYICKMHRKSMNKPIKEKRVTEIEAGSNSAVFHRTIEHGGMQREGKVTLKIYPRKEVMGCDIPNAYSNTLSCGMDRIKSKYRK